MGKITALFQPSVSYSFLLYFWFLTHVNSNICFHHDLIVLIKDFDWNNMISSLQRNYIWKITNSFKICLTLFLNSAPSFLLESNANLLVTLLPSLVQMQAHRHCTWQLRALCLCDSEHFCVF